MIDWMETLPTWAVIICVRRVHPEILYHQRWVLTFHCFHVWKVVQGFHTAWMSKAATTGMLG